jgi:Tol biopolymer transport system component
MPIVSYPAWAPDGRSIAVEVLHDRGSDAAVVPVRGGTPRQLTSIRGESWVHSWTPDSTRVVYAGQRDGVWNIYWVPVDGGPEQRITNYTGVGTFVRYPAWSPQNDQVVYEYGDVRGNVWLVDLP